jgi:hypothetical protein
MSSGLTYRGLRLKTFILADDFASYDAEVPAKSGAPHPSSTRLQLVKCNTGLCNLVLLMYMYVLSMINKSHVSTNIDNRGFFTNTWPLDIAT